jgi:hypothetical protein
MRVKQDKELKLEANAVLDHTADGTAYRFIVGEKGDIISGALYVKQGESIPATLTITFVVKKDETEKDDEDGSNS